MERMSTQVQARSPELDELTCVPETEQSRQAAGVVEVVRVEDPLQMSDTGQGDIAPETQQDSDSSDEDIADTEDTQAAGGTHRRARASQSQGGGQFVSEDKADKGGKKTAVAFSDENEQKLVDFLCDNEILYNKRLNRPSFCPVANCY